MLSFAFLLKSCPVLREDTHPNFFIFFLQFQFHIEVSSEMYFVWYEVESNLFFYSIKQYLEH